MNHTEPTIQSTVVHPNQENRPGNSDQNHFATGILNSVIDVPIYGHNIDNRTGMNPQWPITITTPESNRSKNCNIFK